jgi:hypothetical protein
MTCGTAASLPSTLRLPDAANLPGTELSAVSMDRSAAFITDMERIAGI